MGYSRGSSSFPAQAVFPTRSLRGYSWRRFPFSCWASLLASLSPSRPDPQFPPGPAHCCPELRRLDNTAGKYGRCRPHFSIWNRRVPDEPLSLSRRLSCPGACPRRSGRGEFSPCASYRPRLLFGLCHPPYLPDPPHPDNFDARMALPESAVEAEAFGNGTVAADRR